MRCTGRTVSPSDRALRRQGYVIYAVLCAGLVASQFYRVSNAVIAPELMAELSIGTGTMGVVNGAFFLAFAAMQIPAGMLLDRFGARRMMPCLFLLAVAGSLLYAAAQSGLELIAGRALIGIGCALGLMGALVVIARWFESERYARLISLLFTVGGLGVLMASTPLAAMSEAVGWRGAFVTMAAVTGVLAILLFALVRDAPPGADPAAAAHEPAGEMWRGIGELLARRDMRCICAIQFVNYAAVLSIVGLWAGPYLNDVHGLTGVDRGNALFGLNVTLLLAVLLFAQIERWLGSRKRAIVGGGIAAVIFLVVLALVPDPGLWTALAVLILFTVASAFFMLIHAHARAILPDRLIGRGLTLQNLAVMLGVFVVQAATGAVIGAFAPEGGEAPEIAYRATFGVLALSLAAGVALYARISDVSPLGEKPRPDANPAPR